MSQLDSETRRTGPKDAHGLTQDVADSDRLAAVLAIQQEITLHEPGLDEVLTLVADRVLTITGATGAAIALQHEGQMVCRARSGTNAPELGAAVAADTGLSGECLRTGQTLYCEDAESDPRANRAAVQAAGLRSVVVVPLFHNRRPQGVFELFSAAPRAFTQQDVRIAELLAGLITTAISYSSEFEAKQALESERTAMLQVLEQITPAIEKLLQEEASQQVEQDELLDGFGEKPFPLDQVTPGGRALGPTLVTSGWQDQPADQLEAALPDEDQPAAPSDSEFDDLRGSRYPLPPEMFRPPAVQTDREQEAAEAAIEVLLNRENVLFPEEASLELDAQMPVPEFPSEAGADSEGHVPISEQFFQRRPRPTPLSTDRAIPRAEELPPAAEPEEALLKEQTEGSPEGFKERAKGMVDSVLARAAVEKESLQTVAAEDAAAALAAARPAEQEKEKKQKEEKKPDEKQSQLRWQNLMEFAVPAAVTAVIILIGLIWLQTRGPSQESTERPPQPIDVRLPDPLPRPLSARLVSFGYTLDTPFATEPSESSTAYGFYIGQPQPTRVPHDRRPRRRPSFAGPLVVVSLARGSIFQELPLPGPQPPPPPAVEIVQVPAGAAKGATPAQPQVPAFADQQAEEDRKHRVRVPYETLQEKVSQKVAPIYPQIAMLKGATGSVVLGVVIAKDGSVKDVSAVSGNDFLALAAEAAVRQWKFRPHLVDGKAVEVETEIHFRFVRQ